MMHPKLIQLHQAAQPTNWVKTSLHILLGTLYITALSQIEIPLKPVPVTMQTFAIFSLALFQGSKKASFSALLYLLAATIGLPVLSGGYANPLWFISPYAGYCLSFPLITYLVGKLTELKSPLNPLRLFVGMCLAQLILYTSGIAWLCTFVGLDQALILGLYPFIVFDAIKLTAAFSAKMAEKHAGSFTQLFINH